MRKHSVLYVARDIFDIHLPSTRFFMVRLASVTELVGHADINSTLVYTQVLSLETYHLMQRIEY